MQQRLSILYVANKRLPENDYRIGYPKMSRIAQITYALPAMPATVKPLEFVELGFAEGVGLRDMSCFLALAQHLRRHRNTYHFVHFYSTKLHLVGPICAALAGVPCLTTITGFGRTFNRQERRYRGLRPLYLALAKVSARLAKAVLFQNHGDMHWLSAQMPSMAHKMQWIGSGVDAERLGHKDFGSRPLNVLMAARLMPDKGVPVYLECAKRLQGCGFRFLLAGPGSDGQQPLLRSVEECHQGGAIEYLGELKSSELAQLYRECHVLAFPSRGEGMPRVMLEAGHALMCPLASDIPAHRDLIASGRGILLSPDREVESMVDALHRLNSDRGELERNARMYQQHIVQHYSLAAYAKRMDEFLCRTCL